MQSVAFHITHITVTVNAVNYGHKITPGGFNDQRLLKELRDIFSENSFKRREIFMQWFY
jgi:hypothetical protein